MIDEGLVTLLTADSGVQAALAPNTAPAAIYQGDVPPDVAAYPCIGYQLVGGMSWPTQTSSGPQRSRVQVDCWGTTPDMAKGLAAAVGKALNGVTSWTGAGVRISSILLIHPGIDFFSSDSLFFRRMLEFYLTYTFTP